MRLRPLISWLSRCIAELRKPKVYETYRPETERQRRRREYDNWLKQQQALEQFERGPKPSTAKDKRP